MDSVLTTRQYYLVLHHFNNY